MNTTIASSHSRVTIGKKVLYGVGDLGLAFTDAILGVGFMIFLIDVVELSPVVAGIALFVGRSWDWINDPIVGYLSDRTRTRWGRRRPYLLFGAVPYAIVFAMVWSQPWFLVSQLSKAVYYGAAYTLYYTVNTIVSLPYFSLTPDLTPDYDERTDLTMVRTVFTLLGTGIGIFLGLTIDWVPENVDSIARLGIGMGIGAALPLLIVFFGTRENADYSSQPKPRFFSEIESAFRSRPFLIAAGIILFTFLALETIQQMLLFYLKYHLHMERAMEIVSGSLIISALLSLPLWNRVSERLDKTKAYIIGTSYMAVLLLALIFVPSGISVANVCILAALIGIGFGAVQVLSWAIIPDTVEFDELESGERHEGVFYSLVTLFRKISTAFVLPATGIVLGATGYIANSIDQSANTILAIRLMIGLFPALALACAILLALRFPISRSAFVEVNEQLRVKRQNRGSAKENGGE